MPRYAAVSASNPIVIVGVQLTQTVLSFFAPSSAQAGQVFMVSGTLKTVAGAPLSGKAIILGVTFGGAPQYTNLSTDASGAFSSGLTLSALGTYTLTVDYGGDTSYAPSSASASVSIVAPQGDTFVETYKGYAIWQHAGGGTFYVKDSTGVIADGLLTLQVARTFIDGLAPQPSNIGLWIVAGIVAIALVAGGAKANRR